ncbi:hypothetical protein BDN72DRAFT_854625 [Pluteus cervinus]|uniref:Uncharacterized protein n=1 Tax=Pluteus cervinus TaxID=181527 RepID=A0ACD3B7J1_9AGAR|nr:hypothetical protein BDN72DRAFT_854625 [Pluteus cervinus]
MNEDDSTFYYKKHGKRDISRGQTKVSLYYSFGTHLVGNGAKTKLAPSSASCPPLKWNNSLRPIDNPALDRKATLLAFARSIGGAAQEERQQKWFDMHEDNTWQGNSIGGYCSPHHHGIHVTPLDDKFSVVYWGGNGCIAHELWSFQISRRRPDAKSGETTTQFDEVLDGPVIFAEENISVSCPTINGRITLQQGKCILPEGEIFILERQGKADAMFRLPRRKPEPEMSVPTESNTGNANLSIEKLDEKGDHLVHKAHIRVRRNRPNHGEGQGRRRGRPLGQRRVTKFLFKPILTLAQKMRARFERVPLE